VTIAANPRPEVTVIQPPRGRMLLDLKELWAHRELLFFLTWRDIKVRYKQTYIGVAWAVLQPFIIMLVFSELFGKIGKFPTQGLPGPIFYFIGLLPWTYFAKSVSVASLSLVSNAPLVTKIYFPRILLPASACLGTLVDFFASMVVLVLMFLWFGIRPTGQALWIVPLIGLAVTASLGISLWLSAINVKYRDVQQAVPFLIQIGMFVTPVIYPAELVPEAYQIWYGLNPMVAVVEGFRWALAGAPFPAAGMMAVSIAVSLVLLISGLWYFTRAEREFADVV
jgi:homopolymeric O-antigen transport system permease protein